MAPPLTAAPPRCSVAPTPSTAAHAQAQSSSAQTPSTAALAPLTAAPNESMVAPTPSTGAAAQAQSTSAPAAPTGSTAALAPSTTANGAKPSRHRHHKRDKNYINENDKFAESEQALEPRVSRRR